MVGPSDSSSQIKRILIVGGGSSGWMTASLLANRLKGVSISLVEASDIPIIGVGESTNPVMTYFHRMLDVNERAFMRASNAAYKIAIRFEHFNRRGGVFYHPFGQPPDPDAPLFRPHAEAHHTTFHLANSGNQFSRSLAYAYQIDAGLYGQYLKQLCLQRGVGHIVTRVTGAERDASGNIARIHTDSAGTLSADLYVDCSGFRSFLLGQTLEEPFQSVSRYLVNDRAIAARVPYVDKDRELTTRTNCVALSAGWVWHIPLWSRIGTGYTYCSQFLSPTEAEAEFREHLGAERVKDLRFDHITIRAGRHDRAWVRNCVAVGISYGFLEPLESTGLSLTQLSIADLARTIGLGATDDLRRAYNDKQAEMFDATRDFVMAHFVFTRRDDTPYWRQIRTATALPDSLARVMEGATRRDYSPVDALPNTFYKRLNWNLILSGMGVYDGETPQLPALTLPETMPHAELLRRTVHDDGDGELDAVADTDFRVRDIGGHHPTWHPTW